MGGLITETFYTPPEHVSADELRVEGDEARHMSRVLRTRTGDTVRVVDGCGTAYIGEVVESGRTTVRCLIRSRTQMENEPSRSLALGVAVLKNPARFDLLVEKGTELGVTAIIPLTSARTIPHHARTGRWHQIAVAAMKQSGRCVCPTIREVISLQDFLRTVPPGSLRLIPHERATTPLAGAAASSTARDIYVAVGPEGGFSEEEISDAGRAGFIPVSLGQRRLRTETAALTAAALLLSDR